MRLIIIVTLFFIPLIGFASFPVENESSQAINLDKSENDAESLSSALWPETLVFIAIGGFLYLLYLGVKRLILLFRENPKKFKKGWIKASVVLVMLIGLAILLENNFLIMH